MKEETNTRTCSCCGETKPLEEFAKNRHGYTSICKDCMKKKQSAGLKSRGKESTPVSQPIQPTHEDAAPMPLEYFTDDDIFLELGHRGWAGELTKTEIRILKPKENEN